MNRIVERAYQIIQLSQDKIIEYIPEVEIGEVCEINDIWNGEGDCPENSYSYLISDDGEDGESNVPVYINYEFEIIEEKENKLDTLIKITDISII